MIDPSEPGKMIVCRCVAPYKNKVKNPNFLSSLTKHYLLDVTFQSVVHAHHTGRCHNLMSFYTTKNSSRQKTDLSQILSKIIIHPYSSWSVNHFPNVRCTNLYIVICLILIQICLISKMHKLPLRAALFAQHTINISKKAISKCLQMNFPSLWLRKNTRKRKWKL